jgi:hypothetical protein
LSIKNAFSCFDHFELSDNTHCKATVYSFLKAFSMYNRPMENPWSKLPTKKPFVLPEDEPYISVYNQHASTDHKIITNILPEPFLGNIADAKVVLLNLNPGFDEKDLFWHKQQEFVSENRKDLLHESDPPFYLLNTKFRDSGGFIWWRAHLKQFISQFGLDSIARSFICIEYFPYHSKHYKQMPVIPSQMYSFYLVREAMKRKLPIIIMRGKRLWLESVPDLSKYPYSVLNSPWKGYISENNMPEETYDTIVKLLST